MNCCHEVHAALFSNHVPYVMVRYLQSFYFYVAPQTFLPSVYTCHMELPDGTLMIARTTALGYGLEVYDLSTHRAIFQELGHNVKHILKIKNRIVTVSQNDYEYPEQVYIRVYDSDLNFIAQSHVIQMGCMTVREYKGMLLYKHNLTTFHAMDIDTFHITRILVSTKDVYARFWTIQNCICMLTIHGVEIFNEREEIFNVGPYRFYRFAFYHGKLYRFNFRVIERLNVSKGEFDTIMTFEDGCVQRCFRGKLDVPDKFFFGRVRNHILQLIVLQDGTLCFNIERGNIYFCDPQTNNLRFCFQINRCCDAVLSKTGYIVTSP